MLWLGEEGRRWKGERKKGENCIKNGVKKGFKIKTSTILRLMVNLYTSIFSTRSWEEGGGVLLMGYELYRQLANKRQKRRKGTLDLEEEDRNKSVLKGECRY